MILCLYNQQISFKIILSNQSGPAVQNTLMQTLLCYRHCVNKLTSRCGGIMNSIIYNVKADSQGMKERETMLKIKIRLMHHIFVSQHYLNGLQKIPLKQPTLVFQCSSYYESALSRSTRFSSRWTRNALYKIL